MPFYYGQDPKVKIAHAEATTQFGDIFAPTQASKFMQHLDQVTSFDLFGTTAGSKIENVSYFYLQFYSYF